MNASDSMLLEVMPPYVIPPVVLMAHRVLRERLRVFAEDVFELDGVQASIRDIVVAANNLLEGTSIPPLDYPGVRSRFERDAITMRIQ